MRKLVLLLVKLAEAGANNGESGIFLIQTGDLHGFQYGNPALHPSQIQADLFTDKAHLHFVFFHKKSTGDISQEEINRVIQTVRRADGSPIE